MPEISSTLNAILTGSLTALGVIIHAVGLAPLLIFLRRNHPRVLMYHACEPEESDFTRGLSINTPPCRFEEQLDLLSRQYRIVSLDQLFSGECPDRAVAITFDDGYRSVYQHAFPLLKATGIPATVFLVSEAIDTKRIIWLNALNWYLNRFPDRARSLISERLGFLRTSSYRDFLDSLISGYDSQVIGELIEQLESHFDESALQAARAERLYVGPEEIAEMASQGFTYGNHTATHPNLAGLSVDDQRKEIGLAKRELEGMIGAINALAYPFGIFLEETFRVARELGYSMLLEVKGDNRPLDPLHIARVNVSTDSPAVLFARIEVVYPVKEVLRRLAARIRRRDRPLL